MSEQSNLTRGLTQKAEDDYYSQEIKNLEMLDYYANKMDEIYHYKDYVLFFPVLEKQLINIERWKLFRNICIVVLCARLLFTKPDWCTRMAGEVHLDCSVNTSDGTEYFTVTSYFLDAYNFEIASWFLMLLLILYDLFNLEVNAGLVFTYCILFVFDIISGFFYMNDIISLKVNHLSAFIFLVLYT